VLDPGRQRGAKVAQIELARKLDVANASRSRAIERWPLLHTITPLEHRDNVPPGVRAVVSSAISATVHSSALAETLDTASVHPGALEGLDTRPSFIEARCGATSFSPPSPASVAGRICGWSFY
jgi:hypothetical protein